MLSAVHGGLWHCFRLLVHLDFKKFKIGMFVKNIIECNTNDAREDNFYPVGDHCHLGGGVGGVGRED